MKAFICLLAAALLCGCNKPAERAVPASQGGDFNGELDDDNVAHRLAWFRAGADFAVRTACTNDVTGLRRIISVDTSTYDNNFVKWKASATVEFINHIGGVDRTNLYYRFYNSIGYPPNFSENLSCIHDGEKDLQDYEDQIKKISNNEITVAQALAAQLTLMREVATEHAKSAKLLDAAEAAHRRRQVETGEKTPEQSALEEAQAKIKALIDAAAAKKNEQQAELDMMRNAGLPVAQIVHIRANTEK